MGSLMKSTERGRELEQLKLLEQVLAEQRRTNELLGALVDMRSAELTASGFAPHPLASR